MTNPDKTVMGNCPHGTDEDAREEKARVEAAIAAGQAAAQKDFKAECEKLEAQRDELIEELKELKASQEDKSQSEDDANARLARLQADWDNYRRRTAKERIAEREHATEKLVCNLLPVIDDMERAIAHASQDIDTNESLKQFSDGVVAVREKMLDVLSREGVELIHAEGEPFDPLQHRAVGRVEDKDMYEDTVHDVYQNGYTMADKVIRESMVTVSFGGPKRPQEDQQAQDDESDCSQVESEAQASDCE